MNRILPNKDRALTAAICIGASTVIGIIISIVLYVKSSSMYESDLSSNVDMEDMLSFLQMVGILSIMKVVLTIICAVTFIMWFRRAYANLHRIENTYLTYTEGWAAGAWFVPFGNLFIPYRIMKEIWVETQANLKPDSTHKDEDGLTLIGWWWAFWIFYSIASTVLQRMGGNEATAAGIFFSAKLDLISEIISIPAAVTVILMLNKISEMELDLVAPEQNSDPIDHLMA